MKVYMKNGELTLPQDFSFEITHTNPFFSTDGASSAPVTLPPTQENLEALGHPEDTHKLSRTVKNFDAQLYAGIFFANCKLVVDSASRKSGISASLALKESVMYGELQDKKLTELFAGKFDTLNGSFWSIYHGDRYDPWVQEGYDPHIEEVAKPICVFPVVSDYKHNDTGGDDYFIVNEPNAQHTDFKAANSRTVKVGDELISMPRKYGLEPFMYLWGLIEETFKLCGYTVTENVFKTTSPLSDIVVLHNAVDTNINMYSNGTILYSMIVPDITVGELIGWLRDKFGAVVCAENGEVSIRLFKDIVAQQYDVDLTPYMRDDLTVNHPEPKRLEIEMETSIESAEPAADSLEDLIAAYSSRALVASQSAITGTGLFYVLPLGKYYYVESSGATPVKVGSDAFPYKRIIKDMAAENLKLQDEFVPTVEISGKYYPYIGESVRRRIDNAGDRDENYSQPILICYAPFNSTDGRYAGSSYGYKENGTAINGYPALTPESLFETYWQKYQDLILNGCPELTCELDIPIETLLSMDITTPKRLDGDLVLIKDLKFTLSDEGVSSCEATFQQIAEYSDAIEAPEIAIASGTLRWKYVNTRTIFNHGTTKDGDEVTRTDGLTDYTQADAPSQLPDRAGVVAMYRKRWLDYTHYTSYKSFLSWGHSSWGATENYEEYFISTFNG